METRRIAELLEPFLASPLQETRLDQISTYIDLLLRWNSRINLTAIRAPEQVVTRHFGESLFAGRHLFSGSQRQQPGGETARPERSRRVLARPTPRQTVTPSFAPRSKAPEEPAAPPSAPFEGRDTSTRLLSFGERAERVLDVGSGAGFPGIPLKIFNPAVAVTLLESNQKKVAFLREVIRALTLMDIDVSPTRAEDFPPASAALVTLRAVERFETVLPTAARLVIPRGRLALLIASPQVQPACRLAPSFQWADPIPTPQSRDRVLLIGQRTS
jgi:16S rRNA G527 N7-methylase RsmG